MSFTNPVTNPLEITVLQPSTTDLPTVLDLLDGVPPTCLGCRHRGAPSSDQSDDLLPLGHDPAGCAHLDAERLRSMEDHLIADGRPWFRRPLDEAEEDALPALGWEAEQDSVVLVMLDGPRRARVFTLAEGQCAEAVRW